MSSTMMNSARKEIEKYVDLFWVQVHTVFCIVDYDPYNPLLRHEVEELQKEFEKLCLDKNIVFHYIANGESHFEAMCGVCKVAVALQDDCVEQPIIVFRGNIKFIDDNLSKLIRVSTAMNIYHKKWDLFNLSCEEAVYKRELLKNDIYAGVAKADTAVIISPNIVKKLASTNVNEYKRFQEFVDAHCKKQLLLAHPLCYQHDKQNMLEVLTHADMSLGIWHVIGRYLPFSIVYDYFYQVCGNCLSS